MQENNKVLRVGRLLALKIECLRPFQFSVLGYIKIKVTPFERAHQYGSYCYYISKLMILKHRVLTCLRRRIVFMHSMLSFYTLVKYVE